ncbi:hypothetical protein FQA39_LY18370 [Lamprigera yunnana]|nr:hypothetical protein FQA39_LY18370 [Lamprigera yunnana]
MKLGVKPVLMQLGIRDLSENVKDVANFMGHALNIHNNIYRFPVHITDIVQMSKVLEIVGGKDDCSSDGDSEEESLLRKSLTAHSSAPVMDESPGSTPSCSNIGQEKRGSVFNDETQFKKSKKSHISGLKRICGTKTPWSSKEKHAVIKHFGKFLEENKLPPTSELFDKLLFIKELQCRSPTSVRLWLHNELKSRANGREKPNTPSTPSIKHKVDSIPTSCIQLAKEQIIKYSDPKYNINDFKTLDCETMLLNQTIYLNKSKSKWISVGLYYPFEFASVVKIFGRSKQYVIFKEEEWIQFHEQRENINKYFQTFDTMWKPRQIGSKTLTFEMIEEKKILKIEDMSGNEVYLGWESVSEVWSLESVLRYRLSYSSGSNFKYFYEDVIRAVAEMSGDVKINIYNIINRLSEKSDDVCCMLEVLLFMPEKALFDVQLERRIQEQGQKRVKKHLLKKMWMLYAQEHWTKSYDLKSAVERLYEELGALEFDADHEAIDGMERYYTVQQCEELRDKYKIGRKVCRKFLQGKTCSQCLVKRISEIGLRHFLDTVNKYIKDCSDSSSSSDEEVFKAVEQNGEETTEEEE